MLYRRKPLIVEAMGINKEIHEPGGVLVKFPDGRQIVMETSEFMDNFELVKRERGKRVNDYPVKRVDGEDKPLVTASIGKDAVVTGHVAAIGKGRA